MVNNIKKKKIKKPNFPIIAVVIVIAVFITETFFSLEKYKNIYCVNNEKTTGADTSEMTYKDFSENLESGKVEKAFYTNKASKFSFTLKDDETEYTTQSPETENFKEKLLLNGVEIATVSTEKDNNDLPASSIWSSIVDGIMLSMCAAIILGIIYAVMLEFGSYSKQENESAKTVSFENIIGLDEIKKDLLFLVSMMKEKKVHENVHLPKGILLEGPPGNGKTMLAQALATESGVNFIAVNGSELMDKYIGETGRSVRKLFREAVKNAPCILFIDEIDAIGSKRSEDVDNPADKEFNGIINTLLTRLDGISELSGVTVIAATNMASSLDPALVRPGRFDKKFYIGNPDSGARKELLKLYLKSDDENEHDFSKLVSLTKNCSASEIESIVNEAKIIAMKNGEEKASDDDIVLALKEQKMRGFEKTKSTLNENEKRTAAIHEAGHAIAAHFFAKKTVREITVRPTTSGAGGYTHIEESENDNFIYANEVFGNIVTLLAGRAAEVVINGKKNISFGSDNDISEATRLAEIYVKFNSGIDYSQFGETGAEKLIYEVKKITDRASHIALTLLQAHKSELLDITNELVEKETVKKERFEELCVCKYLKEFFQEEENHGQRPAI